MKNHHAWRKLERGGDRVEIRTDADAIQIAEIGGQDGVAVSAVALITPIQPITPPERRAGLGRTQRDQQGDNYCPTLK